MMKFLSKNKITIRLNSSIHVLNLDEILFCERVNSDTLLHRTDHTIQELGMSFTEMENKLKGHSFIRSNDNYIINLKFLEKVAGQGENTITITGNYKIPIDENLKTLLVEGLSRIE